MFNAIQTVSKKNNILLDPQYIKIDFEKALINAAKMY